MNTEPQRCPTCNLDWVNNTEDFLKSVIAIRNQTIDSQSKRIAFLEEELRRKQDRIHDLLLERQRFLQVGY